MKSNSNIQDIYPLTPMQEGMLYHALAHPDSSAYFEQMSYRLSGEPGIEIIKTSLAQLFKRYDILRTAFVHEGMERPMQVVLKERECGFQYLDISHFESDREKEAYILDFKEKDRARHFHLTKDVLMRVTMIKLGENRYEFTWSNHHILMDGWCIGILIADFFEFYYSCLENRPPRLPGVTPYRNYILWLEKQDRKRSISYWKKYLEEFEQPASIPILKTPNPLDKEEYRVHNVHLELEEEDTGKLNRLLAKYHVTLNTTVQATWGILLSRYTGRHDVVFGSVVSGRPPEVEGVESMVGLFVNSVPVRVSYDENGNTSFAELLKKIQQDAVTGGPFHYHPLAEIQSESSLKQRLLDHLLVFENFPVRDQIDGLASREETKKSGRIFITSSSETFEQTNYNFNLVILPGKRLYLKFAFNEYIHDIPFMEWMAGHFYHLVRQVTTDPERKIQSLELISEEEKKQLLLEFNDVRENFPGDRAIQQLVEDQVEKTPERIAVFYEGERLTYRQVNERANRLARQLRARGVGPDRTAALLLERSLDMAAVMLAVLKAGGACLPLEPGAPQARTRFMLEENRPGAFLIQGRMYHRQKELLEDFPADKLLQVDEKKLYTGDATNPDIVNRPGDLALVFYTSGTTGEPKGILLEHRNVNTYIHNLNRRVFSRYAHETGGILNLGLQAPYTFDGFAQMVLGAMWYGYCAYIVPEETRADGAALLKYYKKHHIHVTDGSPGHLRLMANSFDSQGADQGMELKNLMIAGEILPVKTAVDFLAGFQDNPPTITNSYGPTECCGSTLVYPVTKENLEHRLTLPIGAPMPNTQVYIVDKHLHLQPIGAWGEICIGGTGVGRGYLKREALTKEKFIPNPFVENGRFYRTGDLGRWLRDPAAQGAQMPGAYIIEFQGRIDRQVKIRGFRIEPDEVKKRLLALEDITDAVVIAKEYGSGDVYLCAYYVSTRALELNQLRRRLAEHLPPYMIPAYFTAVDKIPLTPRGKVDVKTLPEPRGAVITGKTYEPPGNETERKIAAIWSEVLGIDPGKISAGDDYYELGGNSINIINTLNRMNKEFGAHINLGFLILYPTIKELAANIHQQGILNKLECVVKLNKGGNKKNIFIIHPMNGQVYIYKDLAKLLEHDYNIYGIQARGVVRRSRLGRSLREMAEDYIYQIRTIQPEGPYLVMGHCIGDVIALRMVKRLEEMKCKVERLIMTDENAFTLEFVLNHLRRKERIRSLFKPFVAVGNIFKKKEKIVSPYADYDSAYKGEPEITPEESDLMKNKVHYHIQKLNRQYFQQNAFKIVEGIIKAPILDIKAKNSEVRIEAWVVQKLTFGSFTLVESDGEHFTMFQEPHVFSLAEVIKNMDKICLIGNPG